MMSVPCTKSKPEYASLTLQKGYFFDDEQQSIQTSDDEQLLRDHVMLSGEADVPFKRIHTIWAILAEILLFLLLLAASFVVPVICKGEKCGTDDIAIVIYAHGSMWFVLLLFDRYFRRQHYVNRLNGYLDFYRHTRNIRRIPFLLASGANAVLLVVTRVLDEYCGDKCTVMKKENYIQIVITIEAVATLPFLFVYLVRSWKFNKRQSFPDVSQDEMLTSFLQSQSQSSEIGFRDENHLEQVLEKQADMIRYLKQHNSQLGKRILALSTENNTLKSG